MKETDEKPENTGNARDGFMMPIGFQADLKPGETRTLSSEPDPPVGFVGVRFVVPADEPERFLLESIVSAGRDQIPISGGVRADVLAEDSTIRFSMDATTVDSPAIEVRVTNLTDNAAVFRAALVGRCPPKATD